MTTAWAFWTMAPGRGDVLAETLPELPAGHVRVRTLYSALSRGSESLVFRGLVPPSEYQRMRAPFQSGDFPAPVKYGYINVGEVIQGPTDLVGRAVFCLHPHQTCYQVPADAVLPLPDDVPPGRAVLAANMETAVNALWDAGPRIGDRITVVGGGVVGMLVAWLCARMPGVLVTLVDPLPERADLATPFGIHVATPEQAPADQDLVFHTSGNPAGLTTALACAGREARVIEMSWYGDQSVSVPLGGAFHSQRLQIRSSQVGTVAPARAARRTYRERLQTALTLLNDPVLDRLITGESGFRHLPETLKKLSETPGGGLCQRIHYRHHFQH